MLPAETSASNELTTIERVAVLQRDVDLDLIAAAAAPSVTNVDRLDDEERIVQETGSGLHDRR